MHNYLNFEKPIAALDGKIEELRHMVDSEGADIAEEVARLQAKADKLIRQTYGKLTPWQRVQVARHPDRPHALDYIGALIDDFTPLAGDRNFAEDSAIVGGLGRFRGNSVVIIGNEKGSDTDSRVIHNFGMAKPEGYRKAVRLMRLADHFHLPVVTLVDTPGAYPGIEAEARGQAGAIASSIETCLNIQVPLISVVIGEGGSGGAIALATANIVLMLENSIYSVISPEGCASILWRDKEKSTKDAAEALKMTAEDLKNLGVIDGIIPEPLGGAHRNPSATINNVARAVELAIADMSGVEGGVLKARRKEKMLAIGRDNIG